MDRGEHRATVHSVTQSWTGLKRLSMQACTFMAEFINILKMYTYFEFQVAFAM